MKPSDFTCPSSGFGFETQSRSFTSSSAFNILVIRTGYERIPLNLVWVSQFSKARL